MNALLSNQLDNKKLQSKSLKKACYMSVAEKMLAFFL